MIRNMLFKTLTADFEKNLFLQKYKQIDLKGLYFFINNYRKIFLSWHLGRSSNVVKSI